MHTLIASHGWRWVAGLLLTLLVSAAVAYSWFNVFNRCEVASVQETSDFLRIQLVEFERVYKSAVSGTRTSLTYPLTVMQQILVDTQITDVPSCLQTAKDELVGYMGDVNQAIQAYVAAEEDTKIRNIIVQANQHHDNFYDELDHVKACAPYCLP